MRETETPTQEAPAQSSLALIPTDTKRADMPTKRRKFTEADKAKILNRINKGEIAFRISKELGISTSVLTRWQKAAKPGFVTAAEKGKAKGKPTDGVPVYTPEFKRAAVARLANETREEVSKDLKVNKSTLTAWAQKIERGLPLMGIGEHKKINKRPYVRKVDKIYGDELTDDGAPVEGNSKLKRNIQSCIVALRGIKSQINVADPVHLVAMVVLATLEGKM